MKLIATKHEKSAKYDALRCIRANGTETATKMPRQGILPHDLIHYVVETALGYEYGFLGLVAKGSEIALVMEQSHDIENETLAAQTIHAEAIVESLQAQLWNGQFDQDQFLIGIESACAIRGQRAPDLRFIDPQVDLYDAVSVLSQAWNQVPFYGQLELDM